MRRQWKQLRVSEGGIMFGETRLQQDIDSLPVEGRFLLHFNGDDARTLVFHKRRCLRSYVRRHRVRFAEVEAA